MRTQGPPQKYRDLDFGVAKSRARRSTLTPAVLTLLVMTAFLGVPGAFSQDFGGFRGLVTDPSGGAIPDAQIRATDEKSGVTSTTTSNASGEYELRGLLPSTYTLQGSAPQFKTYRDTGVILYNREVRRVDVKLQLGSVENTVDVHEQGSTIQTDTASIEYKTPSTEIYGFNVQSWLYYRIDLNPGAESVHQVHGGFANQLEAQQDGISTNADGSWRAPQESTQEVKEVALNAPAEYRTSVSVIGVGKRGSNALHAEVFAHYTNQALNALEVGQANRPPGIPIIRYSYEIAGPVYIPKVYNGKNKTFFHFLFQPQPPRPSAVFHQNFVVPTAKMRTGDISEYVAFRGVTVKDPLTGQPFPGNVIPDQRISPVAKNILKLLPLANTGPADSLVNNFNWTDFSSVKNRWYQLSLDQRLGNKNNLSFRYYRYTNTESDELQGNPFPDAGFVENDWTNAFSIQDSHIFTPRLLNEFQFSWNRQHAIWAPGSVPGKDYLNTLLGITDLGGFNVGDSLGAPRVVMQTMGEQNGVYSGSYNPFPSLLIGSTGSSFLAGSADYTDGYVYQTRDNISYNKGTHLIKTGLEVRYQRPNELNGVTGDTFGKFTFTGAFTGYDYADLLLGLPYQTNIDAIRPKIEARSWEIGAFVQDDWKATPRLTITPGVRFQRYGVPYEKNGLMYNFDVATQRVVVPDERALKAVVEGYPIPVVTAKEAGYPSRLREFKSVLIEPRLGIAYRPFDKTVFRAAYGVYHVPYVSNAAWAGANVFGEIDRAGLLAGLVNGPFQASEHFGPNQLINGVPEFTLEHPFPGGQVGAQDVYSAPINLRKNAWPYDQQWNFTIERELPLGFSLRSSYVGSKGTAWPYVQNIQTPQPSSIPFTRDRRPFGSNFNSINVFELGGNSTHHGLEFEVARQFSKGLYFRAWYAWLKTLNDVQGGLYGSSTGYFIENPYDRLREKGWQDGTVPQSSRWAAVYDLPFGRGQRFGATTHGWLNQIAGNWTVASTFNIQADQRFTPSFSGSDPANVGVSGGRPDEICNGDHFGGGPGLIWNPACFAVPPTGRYGDASRGSLSGPKVWGVDFNVFKQFLLLPGRENSPYLKFEMYATNFFNHHNSTGPLSTDITSPDFGVFVPTGSTGCCTPGHRTIYFRLRVGF